MSDTSASKRNCVACIVKTDGYKLKGGHEHKGVHKHNRVDPTDVLTQKKIHHWHDATSAERSKQPMFQIGFKLIHNAKALLRNISDSDHDGEGAADSFVIADHEAKLIAKGHSNELRRMQRHAGPDLCLAKARALVSHKLDVNRMCHSLLCTAAYTLAYTLGWKRDLPTPGCQIIENLSEDMREHVRSQEQSEKSKKSEKSEKSKKSENIIFCNAKYPNLLPKVLLNSGFGPVHDKPGFWRANTSTLFPLEKFHP